MNRFLHGSFIINMVKVCIFIQNTHVKMENTYIFLKSNYRHHYNYLILGSEMSDEYIHGIKIYLFLYFCTTRHLYRRST
jgi:hypothetical protein